MLRFRDFSCAEEIRYSGYKTVPDGGWHFTFMGGAERIRQKLAAYSHQENNRPEFTDVQTLTERINSGQPLYGYTEPLVFLPIDETFPLYVRQHLDCFAAWIKPV
jgi:beta-1,4-mannosyl-glycoprotein beta-1,4-N-acetylglucosaminyltransferase